MKTYAVKFRRIIIETQTFEVQAEDENDAADEAFIKAAATDNDWHQESFEMEATDAEEV